MYEEEITRFVRFLYHEFLKKLSIIFQTHFEIRHPHIEVRLARTNDKDCVFSTTVRISTRGNKFCRLLVLVAKQATR